MKKSDIKRIIKEEIQNIFEDVAISNLNKVRDLRDKMVKFIINQKHNNISDSQWDKLEKTYGKKSFAQLSTLYKKLGGKSIKEQNIFEDANDYHEVEYYAKVGQHGSVNDYSDFKTALKNAVGFMKRPDIKKELEDEDLWYIGVSGNTNDFAIIYVNEKYIKSVVTQNAFKDSKSYNNWMKIAKKVAKSGKPLTGKY